MPSIGLQSWIGKMLVLQRGSAVRMHWTGPRAALTAAVRPVRHLCCLLRPIFRREVKLNSGRANDETSLERLAAQRNASLQLSLLQSCLSSEDSWHRN